jgi:hypothetical protein
MSRYALTLQSALYAALCLTACTARFDPVTGAIAEETFEVIQGQDTFRGTGRLSLLSKVERDNYIADRAYLRRIAPRGTSVELNHADPRQHRFAIGRLKLAGKTPENSPALFKAMTDLATAHARSGFAVGTVRVAAADGRLQSQHEMLSVGKVSQNSSLISTSSLASRKDRLTHGYVDCTAYDGDGNGIGDSEYVEVFGDMRFFAPQCSGDLTMAAVNSAEGDSFLSESIAGGGTRQSYVLGPVVSFDAVAPALSTPIVNHPDDLTHDNKISVCLDRVWTGDCDVNDTGWATLKLPLKGSVSITNATFDWATIGHYQTDRPDTFSHIFVTLVTNGGGCAVPPTSTSFAMINFWKEVTGTGNQLQWDLSAPAKWASFSGDCRLVQDRVDLTMQLRFPYQSPDGAGTIPLEITTVGTPAAPNYKIQYPIMVTNSCLAEGTLIATSTKGASKVEDLRIGDALVNPYVTSLTITDTAVGTERTPMVRISDALGHELLMTEMHPLYIVDRGMVPAKYLQVGDRVKTQEGPSHLVRISRESYSGRVYNVKLGNAEEKRALGLDQTTLFANGFLVGDGQVQSKYEFMAMEGSTGPTKLPASWRADYLASVARSASAMK